MRIILVKSNYETLNYFIDQINKAYIECGIDTHIMDCSQEGAEDIHRAISGVLEFCAESVDAMITMNSAGLKCYLDEDTLIWDLYNIFCINIIVDHPRYHKRAYEAPLPVRYKLFSVDRGHVELLKRFYGVPDAEFLPHGGTQTTQHFKPLSRRQTVIAMIGGMRNIIQEKKAMNDFYGTDEDSFKLYKELYLEIENHPEKTVEELLLQWMPPEITRLGDDSYRDLFDLFGYIENYFRMYFRWKAVNVVAEAGFPIHVLGGGWDYVDVCNKGNLTFSGLRTSKECLEKMLDTQISLNVMPWFKDGMHERIINSLLCKSLPLTDPSRYLLENFTDRKDIWMYNLQNVEELPEMIADILSNTEQAEEIIELGYQKASKHFTWQHRAMELLDLIKKEMV